MENPTEHRTILFMVIFIVAWIVFGMALAMAMPQGIDRLFMLGWGGVGALLLQVSGGRNSERPNRID